MRLLPKIRRLLARLSPRARHERLASRAADEVRDELDFHLEMRTRELIDAGIPADIARHRAVEAFGSVAPVDAECRRLTSLQYRKAGRGRLLEGIVRDVLAAARSLSRQPLLSVAAVVILACGFASTTVVYGLVDALLLRPLPVREPQRLVALFNHNDVDGYYSSVSYPDYLDYRAESTTLSRLLAYSDAEVTLAGGEATPVTVRAHAVTANYFAGLGIDAALGALFGSSQPDEQGSFEAVVVVSHALWRQRYGASPEVIGQEITINGITATIVGVAAKGFRGVDKDALADLWIPIGLYAQTQPGFADYMYTQRGAHWLMAVGTLAEGATLDDARAEMALLSQQQAEAYPDTNDAYRLQVVEAGRGVIWPERRARVTIVSRTLSAGVALVLLIACANVGNLLLVRAAGRRREFGVRLALGASRARVVRLLLTESVLLALVSGAAGLVLAAWARTALTRSVIPPDLAHLLDGGLADGVLTLTVVLALFAGLAFGLAPALHASNPDIVGAIKSGSGPGALRRGRRLSLGNGLVVAQVALSLPLLVSAALIGRSLWNQMTVDLGVDTHDLLLLEIDLGSGGYGAEEGQAIYDQLLQRAAAMPGVVAAAYTRVAPLGTMRMASDVGVAGEGEDARKNVEINIVSPGYPAASGATVVRGRDFSSADAAGNPAVMVNQAMADLFWPGGDAVGQFIEMEWFSGPIRAPVVGVLADNRYARVRDGQISVPGETPRLYLPLAQEYQTAMTLLIRSTTDARALAGPLLQITRTLAPAVPDVEVESFRGHVARLLPQQRLLAGLLIIAGVIGLVLAAVGVYAVMAYSVSRRLPEMGIRRTLGAQRSDVLRQILGEGLTLCAAGIGVGLLGALAAARLLTSMLYGVESTDPVSYLGVAATLLIVALLATWLPGRAAADSDPLDALRRP
ncbi:MAG: ABC transporter permease [Acidobacteriota bacterium]|jgi:predicted permease